MLLRMVRRHGHKLALSLAVVLVLALMLMGMMYVLLLIVLLLRWRWRPQHAAELVSSHCYSHCSSRWGAFFICPR